MKPVVICLFLIPFSLFGQTLKFEKAFDVYTFGVDPVIKVINSGYLIAGGNTMDAFLMHLNENGDTLWTKFYDSLSDTAQIISIELSNSGKYTLLGYQTFNNQKSYFLSESDSFGTILRIKRFHGLLIKPPGQLLKSSDHGFIVTGESNYNGNYISLITKHDASFNILWSKTIVQNFAYVLCAVEINNSYYFFTQNYLGGIPHFSMLKTDIDGNYSGSFSLDAFPNRLNPGMIIKSVDNHIIFFSHWRDANNASLSKFQVAKIDTSGTLLIAKTFGPIVLGYVHQIIETSDSGYCFLATTFCGPASYKLLLIKTDSNLDTLWTRIYSHGPFQNVASHVQEAQDKGFIISGVNFDGLYLIKTDSLGNSGCNSSCDSFTVASNLLNTSPITLSLLNYPLTSDTLTLTDSSGCNIQTYCTTIGIEKLLSSNNFLVYPNPMRDDIDEFTISSMKQLDHATVTIFNLLGKPIFRDHFSGMVKSFKCKLVAGIYFIQVNNGYEIWTNKIIKE